MMSDNKERRNELTENTEKRDTLNIPTIRRTATSYAEKGMLGQKLEQCRWVRT